MLSALLAIGWEPELRGLLTVVLGTVAFMGSVYLILGTNMGARLGFLVALCGLAGWMALMGAIWWIYGIGLKGEDPSWQQVPGRTVIQDADALNQAGVLEVRLDIDPTMSNIAIADHVTDGFVAEGWRIVGESEPAFGQAEASATVYLEEEGAFAAGENYFPEGLEGERYYFPADRGLEIKIREKLERLRELNAKHRVTEDTENK